MGKTAKQLTPTITHDLVPERSTCLDCGRHLRADYSNRRTLTTLAGVTRLTLTIRRCRNDHCPAVRKPYRPEAEGRFALPRHEFGFDVIALVGQLRYHQHRSIPEPCSVSSSQRGAILVIGSPEAARSFFFA